VSEYARETARSDLGPFGGSHGAADGRDEAPSGSTERASRRGPSGDAAADRFELLVGSARFFHAFAADAATATERVWVQTLSFEGDAGEALTEVFEASSAKDRRLIVDDFNRWTQQDRFTVLPGNMVDPALRRHVARTRSLEARIRASGTRLLYANPAGFWKLRAAYRNHKKILIVDDRVAYVGGINFSDHNFAWHDLMIRITDPAIVRLLARDVEHTWQGRDVGVHESFPGMDVTLLDGQQNDRWFEPVIELLEGAERSIRIQSAYLSMPFTQILGRAAARGVRVTILGAGQTNRPYLNRYTRWESWRHGFELRFLPQMTHMKAIVVDDEVLIAGSANFDHLSYHVLQEVVTIITDPGLRAQFEEHVWEPDYARAQPAELGPDPGGEALLRRIGRVSRFLVRIGR
jgi:cardiolipin synthase